MTLSLTSASHKLEDAIQAFEAEVSGDAKTKDQLFRSRVHDALDMAKEALVAFRRAGDAEKKVAALGTVVKANMALGETFDALMAARDELAMVKRSGDKASTLKVLLMVAEVQGERGEGVAAMESVAEAAALAKGLGDKLSEAKALQQKALLQLAMGKKDKAMATAEEALKMFQELGSKEGEEAASRTINMVFVEKGQLDSAPGRQAALAALEDLAASMERRDVQGWSSAMKSLEKTGAYAEKDIQGCIQKAIGEDAKGVTPFLEEVGVYGARSAEGTMTVREQTKLFTYIGFRMGGLGYGPRFRCLQTHKVDCLNDPSYVPYSVGALVISEEADDWERQLEYHPGCLDGMLQTGAALSM